MTNQRHRRARTLALRAAIALLVWVSLLASPGALTVSHTAAQAVTPPTMSTSSTRAQSISVPAVTPASAPASTPTPVGPSGTWHLKFHDEFTGNTLDRTKWRTTFPWGARTISANHEMEYYADDDLLVSNGLLHIRAERRNMGGLNYTSGMISSYSSFASSYGYFEIRARMPKGKGLWPAFWLLPLDQSWPPEIDVFETLGNDAKTVYMTNHHRDAAGTPQKAQRAWAGPDFSRHFHTFGVEWSPGHLVWYIDGVERIETTMNVPSKPMYVIANLAVGGDWPGAPDASVSFPRYLDIDYIRIYQRAHAMGLLYLAAALVLGVGFLSMAVALLRDRQGPDQARRTFLYSNLYLALLFAAMVRDRLLPLQ